MCLAPSGSLEGCAKRLSRRFVEKGPIGGPRLSEEQSLRPWRRLAWYACGVLVLALLPVAKYAELWGTLPRPQKLALLVAVAAFGAACLLSLWFDRVASWSSVRHALVRSFAVLGLFLIGAIAVSIELPRYLLLPLVVVVAVIVPAAVSPVARRLWPLGAVAAVAVAFAVYSLTRVQGSPQKERVTRTVYFPTAYYSVQAVMREGWISEPATRGGG